MKFKTAKTLENQKNSELDRSRLSERINNSYLDRIVYKFKVIFLGDYCVGKTCVINRYIDDVYIGDYNCTLGVEFKIKSLFFDEKTVVDLQIWDTCGHDKYRGITKQYFRDKQGNYISFNYKFHFKIITFYEYFICN
jgi:GTPase SAR1 family protein